MVKFKRNTFSRGDFFIAVFNKELVSGVFSGIAVFINKLDIRAWANPGGQEARADGNNLINFGCPYIGKYCRIILRSIISWQCFFIIQVYTIFLFVYDF